MQRVGERRDVAVLDQKPVHVVLDEVRDAADPGRDDAAAARERLEDHPAEALASARAERGTWPRPSARRPLRRQLLDVLDAVRDSRPGAGRRRREGSAADDARAARRGLARRRAATRRRASSTPFDRSSMPTKSDVSAPRQRRRRSAGERAEIDVRRERLDRRHPGLTAGELRRVRRERAQRVRVAERVARGPVRERREEEAQPRAAEAGGTAPVAVRLDDDRRPVAPPQRHARGGRRSRCRATRRSRPRVGSGARAGARGTASGRRRRARRGSPASDGRAGSTQARSRPADRGSTVGRGEDAVVDLLAQRVERGSRSLRRRRRRRGGDDQHARPLPGERAGFAQRGIDQRSNARGVLGGRRVPLLVALERGVPEPLGERTVRRAPARAPPQARRRRLARRAALPGRPARRPGSRRRGSRRCRGRAPSTRRGRARGPSERDGSTSTVHAIHLLRDALRQQLLDVLDLLRELGHELVDDVLPRLPLPTITRRASGSSRTTCRQAADEPVDVLVGLEHPDEERGRSARAAAPGGVAVKVDRSM